MVMEGEQGGYRPRNGVYCRVSWAKREESKTETDKFGELSEHVEVSVFISPEVRVPKNSVDESTDWTTSEEMHPFWFLLRGREHDMTNMVMVYDNVTNVLTRDPLNLLNMGAPVTTSTESFHVQVPVLVNNVELEADTELVLKWSQEAVCKPKQEKRRDAFVGLMGDVKKAKTAGRS